MGNAVADYLRTIRTARGITQATLAGAIGVSTNQILRWERGQGGWLKPDALFTAVTYLQASDDDVLLLLRQPHLSGVTLAQQWLLHAESAPGDRWNAGMPLADMLAHFSPESLRSVLDVLTALALQPTRLVALRATLRERLHTACGENDELGS